MTTVGLQATPAAAATATFSNTTAINVADENCPSSCTPGTGSLYPSSINVSGQSGTISHLSVTLRNVSHAYASDFDVLLVGPNGAKFIVVSDVGGGGTTSNVTATFDDTAANALSTSGSWGASGSSVTVKPSNGYTGDGDTFPSPAPAGPYLNPEDSNTFLGVTSQSLDAAYGGISPNGTWNLFVVDDSSGDTGSIAGGWSLNLTLATAATTTTTVTSSQNPSATGSSVTFSAHVADTSSSAAVTAGTVTFKDGGTTLASGVALSSSGVATYTSSALSEGAHTISAVYSGTTTYATSTGTVSQIVDNPTTVSGSTYCNTGAVTINDAGAGPAASYPYPSHISVSNIGGAISKVTATLKGVNETYTDDLDVMLVGPGGQKLVIASDTGNAATATSNATVTLDDDAATQLPSSGGWTTGTYQPTDVNAGADIFPAPAPSGASAAAPTGSATLASVFGGTDPNGQWSLYVVDDASSGGLNGSISGGWCLNFTTSNDPATITAVTSSENPSTTGSPVTFNAHVTASADSSDVTLGTVTFKDGSTVIGGPTALSGTGTASVTTSALTEGTHTITASYSGSAGNFNLSSAALNQEVDGPTVVSGNTYCNNGGLTINDQIGSGPVGTASVYPSRVSVSGVSGTLGKLTVTVKGLTHTVPDDIDMLLVGPGGQSLQLLSDAGGTASVSGLNVTLDDAAGSAAPDTTSLGTGSVTYKPTDYGTGDSYLSPAPAGPYGDPAPAGSVTLGSVFDGTDPNGTWSLYVVDDSAGDTGSISGWCLSLTLPPTAMDDAYTTPVDTTFTVAAPGVLANDSGTPAPSAVPVADGATSQGGTVTLNKDGSFSYAPPAGFSGDDSFTYTSTNGASTTSTATVTMHVGAAPTFTSDNHTSFIVGQAGSFNVTVKGVPDASISENGALPNGITLTDNGNNTATFSGTPASADEGSYSLTLTASNGFAPDASQAFTLEVDSPPTITSADHTTFTAGTAGTFTVTTGPGYPTTTAITETGALPGGVTFTDHGDGTATLSGTPAAGSGGTYLITLTATAVGAATPSANQNFTLTVQQPPALTSTDHATFTAGTAGSFTVTTDPGYPTTTAITETGALPGGVTFTDHGDGTAALSGTPAAGSGGVYRLSLSAGNGVAPDASQSFTLTVDEAPTITSADHDTETIAAAMSFTVTATGYPTPTLIATGALPTGVSFTDNGDGTATLAGVPQAGSAGTYVLQLSADNRVGSPAGQDLTLAVSKIAQTIAVTSMNPGTGVVGGSYTPSAQADSGLPVTISVDPSATSVCSFDGTQVSFDHQGPCVVDFDQPGDGTYLPAATQKQTIAVGTIATATGVTPSVPQPTYGQPFQATATLTASAASPAGVVQFQVDGRNVGAPVPLVAGRATSPDLADATAPLPAGLHLLTATFTPDDPTRLSGSQASTTVVIAQAATTTTLQVRPRTITAQVAAVPPGASTPTGTVRFFVGDTPDDLHTVGTATLVGRVATLSYTVPGGRARIVQAVYGGDQDFTASSASTSRRDPRISAWATSAHPRPRFGWYRSPVTVHFRCVTDGAPLTGPCPAPVVLGRNGAGLSVSRTIRASDGGIDTVTVRVNIDQAKPRVRVGGVRDHAVYRDTAPRATCVGRDALSGVAACRLSRRVVNGVTYITAHATDRAGNVRSCTVRYRLLRTYLQDARYVHGAFDVRPGRAYTLVVHAVRRPRYYDAAAYPRQPWKAGVLLVPAGARRWAIGVLVDSRMRTHTLWNVGVKVGKQMRVVRIRVL